MDSQHSPKQNNVLAALDDAHFERLLPHLELVPLPFGWIVYQAGRAPALCLLPDYKYGRLAVRNGKRCDGRNRGVWQ
jgi:hypothetical protein